MAAETSYRATKGVFVSASGVEDALRHLENMVQRAGITYTLQPRHLLRILRSYPRYRSALTTYFHNPPSRFLHCARSRSPSTTRPSRSFRPGAYLSLSTSPCYADAGIREFSEVHGAKIEQLELHHSSDEIEEFLMMETRSFLHANVNANANGTWNANGLIPSCRFKVPLDTWCPNLREFICSADAEWNW